VEKQNEEDTIGFKKKTTRNRLNWKSSHTADGIADRVKQLKDISGQNVRVEVSDEWTFEYSLAKNGLAKEVYEAANDGETGFTDLSSNEEERAIQILRLIDSKSSGKTQTAYRLCQILEKRYTAVTEPPPAGETEENRSARVKRNDDARAAKCSELRQKLPCYILKAIDYVTQSEQIAEPAAMTFVELIDD
jgi:putative ATP-dependent endonuclease of OLD family